MWGPYGYGMTGYGFGNSLLSLIWWVISIVIIIAVIRFIFGGGRHRHWREWKGMGGAWMSQSALDILKERFAKGEINKEEYEERKKVLSEDNNK